jgi:CRISPR/Cas system CMR subunit Cmr6 (Cas7 group RAMP superfamily)
VINNLLKGLYVQSTKTEPFDSPINFVKFLKEMELYIQRKKGYFDEFSKKDLKKEYYEKGKRKTNYYPKLPNEFVKGTYIEIFKQYPISEEIKGLMGSFDFKRQPELSFLPSHTLFLSIDFELRKPYISQDDEEFYVLANPICKDKVFKVPYVRPSSWKGALRYVALRAFLDNLTSNKKDAFKERSKLIRLFGNEKDKIEEFLDGIFDDGRYQPDNSERKVSDEFFDYIIARGYVNKEGNGRGRLVFYPTFLDKIGLDIIAPHDRKTKTVKVPIQFEIAPETAKGTFALLYVPFELFRIDENKAKEEMKEDLRILKEAITSMLTIYGFGAKTTAGYGVIEEKLEEVRVNDQVKTRKDSPTFEDFGMIMSKESEKVVKNGSQSKNKAN